MLVTFDPVTLSLEENQFLFDHIGEPPVVAASAFNAAINPAAVRPILEAVYGYMEMEKHSGAQWRGVEAVKAAIATYLVEAERWKRERRLGAPRFPSLHSFDSKGRPHRGGPGADSGHVKTYFDAKGNRIPLAINLVENDPAVWTAPWIGRGSDRPDEKDGLRVDNELHRIECLVCNHTEKFSSESRNSYNLARSRMSKHLRKATDEKERHREVHTLAFGASA